MFSDEHCASDLWQRYAYTLPTCPGSGLNIAADKWPAIVHTHNALALPMHSAHAASLVYVSPASELSSPRDSASRSLFSSPSSVTRTMSPGTRVVSPRTSEVSLSGIQCWTESSVTNRNEAPQADPRNRHALPSALESLPETSTASLQPQGRHFRPR